MEIKKIILGLYTLTIAISVQSIHPIKMVVGTYTDTNSRGIYSFSFDQNTGKATALDTLDLKNPSFLTFSKNGKFIYAVTETNDQQASLSSISFNERDGRMQLINTEPTHGEDPCYVEVNDSIALTANYSGGSMSVFSIMPNGAIGKCRQIFQGHIGGPDKDRQNMPHIHCIKLTSDGHILATDFSADQILSFTYSKHSGHIGTNNTPVAAKISKDSGPRHLIFSKNYAHAYLMSELSGRVTVFNYSNGMLTEIQSICSDITNARGGADIHMSPDGKFIYASNRLKADGLSIFKIDKTTGKLTKIGYQLTGLHPRNFAIPPNGKYILVACRDSNVIQVFRRNTKTGLLFDTHQDIMMSKPVCIQFR